MKDKMHWLVVLTGMISFVSVLTYINQFDGAWSTICMLLFSILIPLSALFFRRNNVVWFLFTTFFTTIVVRNADQHDWSQVGWWTALTYFPLLLQLIFILHEGYQKYGSQSMVLSFIRMFIGFNWLTHCTEKLFVSNHDAGLVGFFQTVVGPNTFGTMLSEQFAVNMIIFGGLVELTAAISLGLGVLSRFGALAAALYLIAAEVMSGHFGVGYTWMMPGGGWEVPFYFFMVTIPFMLPRSGGALSLDKEWRLSQRFGEPIGKATGF
ncbi:TPA: DoxX family membrane protein [Aeromonas veronii]|nr:DoxX family membrane protein [Aeromonas veronii]